MPVRNPNDCDQHAERENGHNRRSYEEVMLQLPKNQSGAGRAKCQYCAYERGYADALLALEKSIIDLKTR